MGRWKLVSLGWKFIRTTGLCAAGMATVLSLESVVGMAFSMILSLVVYAWAFGWKFAVGFLILLLVHELGHVAAAWIVGLRSSIPLFIPFFGAVISLRRPPINAKMEANIAIGGPAAGTLSAMICLVFFLWTDNALMLVLSYTACILNLFNLIPCLPLDGGKIAAAISPHSWWAGSLALGLLFFFTYNLIILMVFLFSLFRLWRNEDSLSGHYYDLDMNQRLKLAWWYFGLLSILGVSTYYIVNLLR